jgi:dephospho-CoA kinase
VIDADEATQLARVKQRDGITDTQVAEMLKTQISRDERIKRADDIIYNHGSLNDLKIAVEQLHLDYLKKSC